MKRWAILLFVAPSLAGCVSSGDLPVTLDYQLCPSPGKNAGDVERLAHQLACSAEDGRYYSRVASSNGLEFVVDALIKQAEVRGGQVEVDRFVGSDYLRDGARPVPPREEWPLDLVDVPVARVTTGNGPSPLVFVTALDVPFPRGDEGISPGVALSVAPAAILLAAVDALARHGVNATMLFLPAVFEYHHWTELATYDYLFDRDFNLEDDTSYTLGLQDLSGCQDQFIDVRSFNDPEGAKQVRDRIRPIASALDVPLVTFESTNLTPNTPESLHHPIFPFAEAGAPGMLIAEGWWANASMGGRLGDTFEHVCWSELESLVALVVAVAREFDQAM